MMQRLKKTAALAVTLALSLLALATPALAAKAQLPELPKGQCVVDEAGVLSQNTVQLVEQLNGQLEANCQGAQIGVLTVEYTGNLSTEEYAVQAFNAWGIGSAKEDNGVLILLVMESPLYKDGDYYLTIGDGFRNTTMDKQASAIAQTMENAFARQDYDDAVEICAQNAAQTIAGVYGTSLTGGGSYQPQPEPQGPGFFAVLFDIALFLLVAWVVMNAVFAPIGRRTNFCFGPFWCWGPPRGPASSAPPSALWRRLRRFWRFWRHGRRLQLWRLWGRTFRRLWRRRQLWRYGRRLQPWRRRRPRPLSFPPRLKEW